MGKANDDMHAENTESVARVHQVIQKAEELVTALDETVAELVEMLRRYAEEEGVK